MFSKTQTLILQSLANAERTLAEIARHTGLSKPNLSQQLMRLEKDGWINRRTHSKKKVYYCLATQADFAAQLHKQQEALLQTIYEPSNIAGPKLCLVAGFSLNLTPGQRQYLDANFALTEYPESEEQMTPELFTLRYKNAHIALITHTFGFLKTDLVRQCSKLQHVVYMGKFASEYIDKKVFEDLGITYWDLSRPDTNFIRNSSAEFMILSILALLRPSTSAEQQIKITGRATSAMQPEFMGEELAGKTVGIIGTENSAKFAGPIIQQFGATTLFADPDNKHKDPFEWGVSRFYSVSDLFSLCDIVVYSDNYYKQAPNLAEHMREGMHTRYLLLLGEYTYTREFMCTCRHLVLIRALKGLHLDYWSTRRYEETPAERLELLSEVMHFPNVRVTPFLGPTSIESNIRRNAYTIDILRTIKENFYAR